ncbi:hypothetical protein DAD99_10880 [Pseudarthrobacter sp. AB1]|nr:hypothetical protein [Pseudarthrobacter sp. AB1]
MPAPKRYPDELRQRAVRHVMDVWKNPADRRAATVCVVPRVPERPRRGLCLSGRWTWAQSSEYLKEWDSRPSGFGP